VKIIDTHTTVKELIAGGFSENQAEILVDTFVSRGIDKGSFAYFIFITIILIILYIRLIRSFWK
jgi:hypothetical protein